MATTAVLTLQLEAKQLQRGLLKAESRMMKMEKRAGGLGTVMKTIFAAGMIRAGFSMIKMAADAEETASKLRAVFKGIEKEATVVTDNIVGKFGLANSTVEQMMSLTGGLLTAFGFTGGEALKMAASVTELAVDLKSFQNLSGGAIEASKRLTSALTGEVESLKMLQVVVQQGTKEFKDQVKAIQKQTGATLRIAKAQVIWQQIQEQTKNAQGDALATYDSTANRLDRMGQGWIEVQESMGSFLIEGLAVDDVVSGLTDGMKFLTSNAHNVRLGIDAIVNSLSNLIAKGAIVTENFFKRGALGARFLSEKLKSVFTGDDAGVNRIKAQIKFSDQQHKAMLKGLENNEIKQAKIAVDRHKKVEKEKRKITTQNAEDAIKDAIKKTEGTGSKGIATPTTTASNQRSEQFAGAFEKGSVDAYKVEKNKTGNRTERDNLKANNRTADAIENVSATTTNIIAG